MRRSSEKGLLVRGVAGKRAEPPPNLLARLIAEQMTGGLFHGSVLVDGARLMCRCGLPLKLDEEIMPHLEEVENRTGFISLHNRRLFWDSEKDCEA